MNLSAHMSAALDTLDRIGDFVALPPEFTDEAVARTLVARWRERTGGFYHFTLDTRCPDAKQPRIFVTRHA